MIYPRAFLRAGVISSPGEYWAHQHRFSRGCYRKWPQGGSISSRPALLTWATRASGPVLFWVVLGGSTQRLCLLPSSPVAFLPLDKSPTGTPLCSGSCPPQVERKEAGGGNPTPRTHGAQRPHLPLGGLGLALLPQRPLGLETVGSGRGEQEARSGGRSLGHSLPSARSPRTVPPGDLILLRPQGLDTSPGPQR